MLIVLTTEEEFQTWLNGTPADAYALVRQFPPEQMRIVQEGFEKKDNLAA
jgi:putative SOS response-associated peptidase YedK